MALKGIETKGFDNVKQSLRKISNGFRHATPLLTKIEEKLEEIVNESINGSKSATTGRAFKPLSPTTLRLENKKSNVKPLSSSLSRVVSLRKNGNNELTVSVSIPYAAIHQFGNPKNLLFGKNKAPIPRRPFLPITKPGEWSKSFLERVNELTTEYLQNLLKK